MVPANVNRAAPLYLGCQDKSFTVDGEQIPFPEVPFIAAYFVDWVLSSRHKGAWRFNPSDMYGNPRKPFETVSAKSKNLETQRDWDFPAKRNWLAGTDYRIYITFLLLTLYLGSALFR